MTGRIAVERSSWMIRSREINATPKVTSAQVEALEAQGGQGDDGAERHRHELGGQHAEDRAAAEERAHRPRPEGHEHVLGERHLAR